MTAGDKEAGSGRHTATGTRAAGSGMLATRTARAHEGLGGDEDEEQPGGVVGGEDEEIDRTESRISQVQLIYQKHWSRVVAATVTIAPL